MAAVTRVQWHLDVVDKATKPILAADRKIRSSVEATERAQARATRAALTGSTKHQAAATRAAVAERRAGEAAQRAARELVGLAGAQTRTAASSGRIVGSASRVEQAYRRQARAVRDLTAAERDAARVRKAGGAAIGGAAGLVRRNAGLVGAGVGIAGLAGVAKTAVNFEATMAKVQARLIGEKGLGRSMKGLEQTAINLGARTQFSAQQAAGAMEELAAQGFSANRILKVIPGTLSLAAASGIELADAAAIQTQALHGFGLAAKDANRVADVLAQTANRSAVDMYDLQESLKYIAPIAKASGQSLESMTAALGLMGNVGIKGSQAGTTLRTAMVRLTAPTEKAQGALADLGIKAADLRGPKGLLPFPQILGRFVKGAQGVDKATRNAALAAIFGREALSGVVALVEAGPAKYRRMEKALESSSGAAKKAADVQRNTVAGAWDNFTGSVESAAIALTTKYRPAIKEALNAGAGGISDFVFGATHTDATEASRKITRGAGGRVESVQVKPLNDAQKAGQDAAKSLKEAADAAKTVLEPIAKLTVHATKFAAANPGIVKVAGALLGVRLAVAGIRFAGAITGATKFLRLFRGAGSAQGAGIATRLISGFRGSLARGQGGLIPRVASFFRGVARPGGQAAASSAASSLASAFPGSLKARQGRVTTTVSGTLRTAGRTAGTSAAASGAESFAAGIGPQIKGKGGGRFAAAGRLAGGALKGGLMVAVAGIGVELATTIIGELQSKIQGSNLPDPIKKLSGVGSWIGRHLPQTAPLFKRADRGRAGGRMTSSGFRRYQGGGMVPAFVSPGERAVFPDGSSATIPGARVAADSVFTPLPVGTAILTSSGQSMVDGGMPLDAAIASQAPHFRAGGYVSTSYGPPWGGIQGTGVTRTGVNLKSNPHLYGIAVDPTRIPLGSKRYVWPNPFGYGGAFRAFDTGGAIKGNRIDFYDWRGRGAQNGWGRRNVTVSTTPLGKGKGATGSTADAKARIPLSAGRSSTRGGVVGDAFGQAIDAARAGNPISRARFSGTLRQALGQVTTSRTVTVPGAKASSAGGGTPAGVYTPSTRWNPSRKPIARWIAPYLTYGASHGWSGTVTSGFRSRAEQTRIWNSGVRPAARPGTSNHEGSAYPRGAVDVTQAAQLSSVLAKSPPPHLLRWAGSKDPVHFSHPHGGSYRRGGIIGLRSGGRARRADAVGRGLTAVGKAAGGSLDRFLELVDNAAALRLEGMRRSLVARIRKGGDRRLVARLQASLSAIDNELGKRIGTILSRVDERAGGVDVFGSAYARFNRRLGIDEGSSEGIRRQIAVADVSAIPAARQNLAELRNAAARAKRAGHGGKARELQKEVDEAQATLDEALTSRVEAAKNLFRQIAQERVDAADFGLSSAQGSIGLLEAGQRIRGIADTPQALREKAFATGAALIPALQARQAAASDQARTAWATGDAAGFRQALLDAQSAATDLASTMADVGDLLHQAAQQAAQDVVDAAGHRSNLASTGLSNLELTQKLAGTYESGGAERAAFITQTVVPALQGELDALRRQEFIARAEGDAKLADQIAEAIAGKQNDVLEAQLAAQETIADNTGAKDYRGTSSFSYRDQAFVGLGVGS